MASKTGGTSTAGDAAAAAKPPKSPAKSPKGGKSPVKSPKKDGKKSSSAGSSAANGQQSGDKMIGDMIIWQQPGKHDKKGSKGDRSVRLRQAIPEQSNDYRVVVFGAAGVGKSSIVLRFVKGTFRENYIPTIEDTYRQVISSNKNVCTLQITDTTGSHQFPAMQRLSISKGHAFILVYSITSRQSLTDLLPIISTIHEIKTSEVDEVPIMVVGNKSDETSAREVLKQDGEAQAKHWKCSFIETSAKTNDNVKELFEKLLHLDKSRPLSLHVDVKKSSKSSSSRKSSSASSKKHSNDKTASAGSSTSSSGGSGGSKCVLS